MTKKRHLTKRYKKHTKKYKKIRIRKTRIKRRGIRKTRRLNKKQRRGGGPTEDATEKKKFEAEIKSKVKEVLPEENFDNINKEDFLKFIKDKLVPELIKKEITVESDDANKLITNYYNSTKTEETEMAKIQAAYNKYYNYFGLTNEQFIYLIIITNASDIEAYFNLKDIPGQSNILKCIVIKFNELMHPVIIPKKETSKERMKREETEENVRITMMEKENIEYITNITDGKIITEIINTCIFTCVFYINMQIMKYKLKTEYVSMGEDNAKKMIEALQTFRPEISKKKEEKKEYPNPEYDLGAADEEPNYVEVYNPDEDEAL